MCLLGFIVVFSSGCSLYLLLGRAYTISKAKALFQGPIIEFRLGYSIFYLGTSKFSPQHKSNAELQDTHKMTINKKLIFTKKFIPSKTELTRQMQITSQT